MRSVRSWLLIAVALLALAGVATAQTTNGTISGHVADAQGLALPGVTVNATSPNLQGVRTVVTSENGDFVLSLLPSGTYTLTFELSGFQTVTKTVALAPTQILPLDAHDGSGRHHRDGQRRRPRGGRADADLAGRDQLQAGPDHGRCRPTRDINAIMLHGAGRSCRPGRAATIRLRGAMSFESAVHDQRRQRQREHPRPGEHALHRGRDSGDDGRDRGHFGRVRPLHRRRGERRSPSRAATVQRTRSATRSTTTTGAATSPANDIASVQRRATSRRAP